MSSETSSTPVDRQAPKPMALQNVGNAIVRGLLSTPGIASGIGKRLITLYVVGRKSGKHYSVPVAYTTHDGALLVGTPFGWGKNLRTGEPLEVRYLGKRRTADVEVVKDETGVVALYDLICRANRQFASFNKVRIDAAGNPDATDLRAAWEHGARVFKLRLR
jgi:deazaflavin-dependent oxidoreductase (nitroreductase family)